MNTEEIIIKNPIYKKWWFWLVIITVTILVLLLLIKDIRPDENNLITNQDQTSQTDEGRNLSHGACTGEQKTKLSVLPMDEGDFSMVLPYGLVVGAHVTPIDHQYFSPASMKSTRDAYPVYAMADARLVSAEPRVTDKGTEYRLVFSVSCKLFYYYDLVTSLTPEIMSAVESSKKSTNGLNLEVKAGQLVGRIGGQTLDFAVWDMDSRLSGFVIPEHYKSEIWKIHTVDPLNYYTDELKIKVLSKYIRTAEPKSGKIDHDIDGKLVGNWFLEGTNGYEGKTREKYWVGHLSIAYDYIDPTSIVISVGDYSGEAMQFGVKGNSPDPATVGIESGLIKYQLIQQDWQTPGGANWDRQSLISGITAKNHENQVEGTVLVQMLEGRKIKFEAFPGKTAAEVTNFDQNVKIYER